MLLTINDDELYQGYLAKVYQQTEGYLSYSPAQRERDQQAGICTTYGELHYYSTKKICRLLKLTEQDIFLDLGSGLGKCALQVFMQTEVKQVIGIEAIRSLAEQAEIVELQVYKELPSLWENQRNIKTLCDNFVTCDWLGATAVYTCSTCFTQELLVAIGDRINRETQVKQALSLRPLPTIERLKLRKVFMVECSWDSALCYYYT